jgi:hypothetical protein
MVSATAAATEIGPADVFAEGVAVEPELFTPLAEAALSALLRSPPS